MALVFLVSIVSPTWINIKEVLAASDNYNGVVYVDISQNKDWKSSVANGDKLVIYNNNDSSNPVELVPVEGFDGLYKTSELGQYNGNITVKKVQEVSEPRAGKGRVYLNLNGQTGSENWQEPKAYMWVGGYSNAEWGGVMMNHLQDEYYYYDYDTSAGFTNIIFNNHRSSGGYTMQTQDLYMSDAAEKPMFTFSGKEGNIYFGSWQKLPDELLPPTDEVTLSISDRKLDTNNKIYIKSDGSAEWSKYENTDIPATLTQDKLTQVKLYAPNWSTAGVYYDTSDPAPKHWQSGVKATISVDDNKSIEYFVFNVPTNSSFQFGTDENSISTDSLTVPDNSEELYYNIEKKDWVTKNFFSKDFYIVDQDNFDNPNGGMPNGGVEILGVTATYYDYLSDFEKEADGNWRKKTYGTEGSEEWKWNNPFNGFNSRLNQYYADQTGATGETWGIPLYFGNFYPTLGGSRGYLAGLNHGNTEQNHWYYLAAQNSNYLTTPEGSMGGSNDTRYQQGFQGLVHDTLNNGNLMVGDNGRIEAPWFNSQWLRETESAKIIQAKFPFVVYEGTGDTKYYYFNSMQATDNVYFTWDNQGIPTSVNYGHGKAYGIANSEGNYGVFPFNSKNANGYMAEEGVGYGFGVKLEIEFYLPENGKYSNGESAKFVYSADDDLWVFVDDQLVLDVGGNHSWCEAQIDFGSDDGTTITGTVERVYSKYNSKTSSVDQVYNGNGWTPQVNTVGIDTSDTTKKHKLTMFYMERGLGSSNLEAGFTMIPASADLNVKNTVNVDEINEGLKEAVKGQATFNYTATQNDVEKTTTLTADQGDRYDSNGFTKSADKNMNVTQTPANSIQLKYDTTSQIYDNRKQEVVQSGGNTSTGDFSFWAGADDEVVNLLAEFTNTFRGVPLYMEKKVEVDGGTELNPSVAQDRFTYQIKVKLSDNDNYTGYKLQYYLLNSEGEKVKDPDTGKAVVYSTDENGIFSLKAGERIVFEGIPVGASVQIEETNMPVGYKVHSITGGTSALGAMVNLNISDNVDNDIVYTNLFTPVETSLTATKNLNGTPYTGSEFIYKAVPKYTDTDDTTFGEYESNIENIVDGKVQFAPIRLSRVGRYIYEISEDAIDSIKQNPQEYSKYTMDGTKYYAEVSVVDDDHNNILDVPPVIKYYKAYDENTNTLSKPVDRIVWNNKKVVGTDIEFTKVDENGLGLPNVKFEIYKNYNEINNAYSEPYTTNINGELIGTNGTVTSSKSGLVNISQMEYSTENETIYYFNEVSTKNDKQLLTRPVVVKIASNGTYKVFYNGNELVDNQVTNLDKPDLPAVGGIGVILLYVLSSIIIIVSGLAYVIHKRKSARTL